MKKFLLVALFLMPSFAFAQTEQETRNLLTQQLLSVFVVQVNAIDKMLSIAAQAPDPTVFNSLVDQLRQQLALSTAQLATLLNNAPAPSGTTGTTGGTGTIAPPQTTEAATTTSLLIEGSAETLGANCRDGRLSVYVLDQNGNKMSGKEVTMTTPFYTEKATTGNQTPAVFSNYFSRATSTTEVVNFFSAGVSKTHSMMVRSGLYGKQLLSDGSRWYEPTSGVVVDPVTRMCL